MGILFTRGCFIYEHDTALRSVLRVHSSRDGHHVGIGVGIQRCAADQRAVNIGLLHNLADVAVLGAAAIEDACVLGFGLTAVQIGDGGADFGSAADIVGLFRCRSQPRADGPDRLVCND